MNHTAQFNPLPLLSVRPGITSSLDQVERDLAIYFAAPEPSSTALQNALAELHRICGVLQIISLKGVAVYSSEIEKLLQELAAGSLPPSPAQRDIIQRSLVALSHYLDAVIEGASNAPLRLFHQYQELQQTRGVEMSFEVDLFFPELQVELPHSVLGVPQETDVQPRIKAARSQYQQALLKWLRQNNPEEALQSMHTAVLTVMCCVPKDQRRAFWWIAAGLIDCLIFDGLPPGLNAKGLLSRVDMQMKSLLEGSQIDAQVTTCEILYFLARSHVVSELVDSIKQVYALDDYLPDESALPQSESAKILDQMRIQLGAARELWEKCLQSDGTSADATQACQDFINQIDQLRELADSLDRNTLQLLCNQVHAGATHCDQPERAQRIAQDMAMALLLLEIGIDHYSHLGSDYHDQARILGQRLQSSMMRMPEDKEQFSVVVTLHSEMEKRKVLAPLASEMQGNLQHVEQGLNAFFADPSKRDEVIPLGRLLHQVLAAMHLLALDQAETLLFALQQVTERYAAGRNPAPAETRAVALALSAIEAYVQNLAHGQKSDVAPLVSALRVMVASQQAPAPPVKPANPAAAPTIPPSAVVAPPPSAITTTPAAAAPIPVEEDLAEEDLAVEELAEAELDGDEDMLEIFLEEAQEVLGTLRTNLALSQLHLESREPLVTIRRGLHTLKGSGRMVGLVELGEVAWAMENSMNIWLDNAKSATPELLKFLSAAEQLFQGWVNSLAKREAVQLDYSALLATAKQIASGAEIISATQIELVPDAAPEPSVGPKPDVEQKLEPDFKLDIEPAPELTLAPQPEPQIELEPGFKLEIELLPDLAFELESEPEPSVKPEPSIKQGIDLKFDMASLPALTFETEPTLISEPESELEPVFEMDQAVAMSPELFRISTQEAAQNVAVLQSHLAALSTSEPSAIPYDFMRAAHTLGGVHRAIGYFDVAELAQALELWLQARMDRPFTLSQTQQSMLENVVSELESIGLEVSNHREYHLTPELISQLQADTSELPTSSDLELPELELPERALDEILAAVESSVEAALPTEVVPKEILPEQVIPEQVIPEQEPVAVVPTVAPATPAPPLVATLMTRSPSEVAPPIRPAADDAEAQEVMNERVVRDDLDEQLLPIFLEEAADLYSQITSDMRSWIERPSENIYGKNLQRTLHTLKGSARMVGAMRLGELTHITETHVEKAASQQDAAFWEDLQNYADRIGNTLERLRSGAPAEVAAPIAVATPTAIATPSVVEAVVSTALPAELPVFETSAGALAAAMLRVRSDTVDSLVNEAGEISVTRSRIEGELRGFKSGLKELTNSIERLRKQLREIEIQAEAQMQARVTLSQEAEEQFDPLEFDRFTQFQDLTRSMNESVHDVQTVQQALLKNLDETSAALTAQAHLNRELQQRLMSIRMVPFSTISERLYRIIRRTGKELGKKVNLEILGGDVELDRSMLEKMTAPFEHMLRNSIDHGLENSEERIKLGKLPIGEIRLALRQENNEVVFEFADDGAGLDLDRLYQKALEHGIFQKDEKVTENQITQVIFATGLSTAQGVTEISGRGVGMDVVGNDIAALGGRIDVFSERGIGARFVIRLPLTLAVGQTLMVQAAHETYAINAGMIEQVQQIKHLALVERYNQGEVEWEGNHYPLFNLMRLLGNESYQPEGRPYNPILLLRSGERRMALHVDELIGNQEVVVKNIGPQLARLPGIAGATVLGSGKVVLIINPITLEQYASGAKTISKSKVAATPVTVTAAKLLVMVVDDSLTVRKVTSRMLIRAGYQVVTANDGVDALEKLAEFTPDMMLLDIEMPRMDGFELTKRLRSDQRYKNMPIIIITSRAAEKHRLYALELGVNAYLGKPYQEVELLEHVKFYSEEELHHHANFHRAEGLLQQIAGFIATKAED